MNRLTRREFTLNWVLTALGGVVITVTGCSDSSPTTAPTTTTTPPTPSGDLSATISGNHGHVATINGAQLAAAMQVILDIAGTADHSHSVMLSADEVSQIASRQRVSKRSSDDQAHSHLVTFN